MAPTKGSGTNLGHSKEESSGDKTSVRLDLARQGHDDAPGDDQSRDPDRGTDQFKTDVAGDFQKTVRNEEDHSDDIVLVPSQFQIGLHPSNLCIAN